MTSRKSHDGGADAENLFCRYTPPNVTHDGEGTAIVIEIGPKKEDAHVGVALTVCRYDVTPNFLPVFDAIRKSDKVCVEGELKKPLRPELVPTRIERMN